MSSKRRQYPRQQYAAYEVPTAPPVAAALTEQMGALGLEGQPLADPYSSAFGPDGYPTGTAYGTSAYAKPATAVPMGAPGAVPAGGGAQHGAYAGAPGLGGYGNATAASAQKMPMNELFTVDLLQQMPPPVDQLDLPPPPLVVPPAVTMTHSDYANASPDYVRSTLNVVPKNSSLLKKSKLPFALVLRPFIGLKEEDEQVPIVTDLSIVRCRRCRTYINPFCTLLENNSRWRCSTCSLANQIPQAIDMSVDGRALNMFERPELNYGLVDFLASQEYLAQPPQPPTYVFVIDVSVAATSIGALHTVASTIRNSLDRLPNRDGRTRVAFIGVDSSLTFFQIPERTSLHVEGAEEEIAEPRLLVVSDLEDPFLPSNAGVLVNLQANRKSIERLLELLPQLYQGSTSSVNALGSGLKAAFKLISNVGGKIIAINSSLPSSGIGKLEVRDERKLNDTGKGHQLLSPQNNFYKSFAVDCNRHQISVDMFLLSNQYQDVASLSNLTKFTAGATYFYPGWKANCPQDVEKLENELGNHLSQDFGQEGMVRVRASSDIRTSSFSGHFFVRSSDLMTFPNIARDHSYVIDLSIEETITKPFVTLQTAVLFSTANGERRIRVMTVQIPVSEHLGDVYASADQLALAMWHAHQAAEKVISVGMSQTQIWLNTRITEILKAYRSDVLNIHTGSSGALSLCANLTLLPLLLTCLKRNVGCQTNSTILSDIRIHALDLLTTLPLPSLIKYLHPELYALHDLSEDAGMPDENGTIVLPARLNLSGEHIQSHGLYLLDNGQCLFLWVGAQVVPQLLLDAFGTDNLDEVPSGKAMMPEIDSSDLNVRIRNIIGASRNKGDSVHFPSLYVIREKGEAALRVWATALLVEDRSNMDPTYHQYLSNIREKLTT